MSPPKHPLKVEYTSDNRVIIRIFEMEIDVVSNGDGLSIELKEETAGNYKTLGEIYHDWPE